MGLFLVWRGFHGVSRTSGDHRASKTAYAWFLPGEHIGTISCGMLGPSHLCNGPILVLVSKSSSSEQLVANTDFTTRAKLNSSPVLSSGPP